MSSILERVLRLHRLTTCLVHNGRLRLIFTSLIALSILGIICTYQKNYDIRICFIDQVNTIVDSHDPQRLEDVLQAALKPTPGQSIFFHETSCYPLDKKRAAVANVDAVTPSAYNFVQLNARQACAIESAALHNPNFTVFVLFASPAYRDNTTIQPLLDAILSYQNVYLRNLNLWTYAAGTPIYEWLKDGKLFRSRFLFSHLSDFLRYLTLYRYGGTYLDMDIVVLRSLEEIPPNYTGAESNTHLAAGVMNFAHDGIGHEIAKQCLQDLRQNFNGNDWGNNGPGVITRVAQKICGTKDIQLMTEGKRCMGFNVFSREAFYAIPWLQWKHFFEPKYLESTLERTRNSYVVHVWNFHSKEYKFKIGTNAAYGKFAEEHCPKVYVASGEYF